MAQTFTDWEMMVVDDGSTDNTRQIVENFIEPRIKYFYLDHQGRKAARSAGFEKSTGESIIFLDADDWWEASCLEKLHQALTDAPTEIAVAHCDFAYVDGNGNILRRENSAFSDGPGLETLALGNLFAIHAALVKRAAIESIGGFPQMNPGLEDWELWIEIAAKGFGFVHLPELLAYYNWRSESVSKNVDERKSDCLNTLARFWSNKNLPEKIKMLKGRSYANAYLEFCTTQFDLENMQCARADFKQAMDYDRGTAFEVETYYRIFFSKMLGNEFSKAGFIGIEDYEKKIVLLMSCLAESRYNQSEIQRARSASYMALGAGLYAKKRLKEAKRSYLFAGQLDHGKYHQATYLIALGKSCLPTKLVDWGKRLRTMVHSER